MQINEIPLALTGDSLIESLGKVKERRKAIAEGFLYQQTINMIAADPGTGKSTISAQVAVELSAGLPVFGLFPPPRPMKVLYIQTERSIVELLERLEVINKAIPINKNNLVITDEYQRFNLLNEKHANLFIDCVLRDCPDPDIVFIDPIYCLVMGGLKDDTPASVFTKVMSTLQKYTGATLWYNHHTVKTQYHEGNVIEKADPYYGSQWLKAHVTGYYYLKDNPGGVRMDKKKDNYRLLPDSIILEYNPENGLCSIPLDEMPATERLKNFIRARELDKKEFYFKDIEAQTKLSTRRLRELLMHSSFKDQFFVVSSYKNKNLYKIAQSQT